MATSPRIPKPVTGFRRVPQGLSKGEWLAKKLTPQERKWLRIVKERPFDKFTRKQFITFRPSREFVFDGGAEIEQVFASWLFPRAMKIAKMRSSMQVVRYSVTLTPHPKMKVEGPVEVFVLRGKEYKRYVRNALRYPTVSVSTSYFARRELLTTRAQLSKLIRDITSITYEMGDGRLIQTTEEDFDDGYLAEHPLVVLTVVAELSKRSEEA